MATVPTTRWDDLLSSRAQIGWTGPDTAGDGGASLTESLYEFGGGLPDPASFPHDAMLEATARMLREVGDDAMTYGEAQGYLGLRELVCHKYELFEGLVVSPENILIANGSGNALSLAFSTFVDIGDPIITEAPTFSGTLNTIRRHGAEIHGVPVDDDGIVTSAVREVLEKLRAEGRRCKLIYTIVNFQNPSGPTMSLERRKELVALAAEFETLILEDDAYGELRFEGHTHPVALRAGPERPHHPGRHALEDPGRRRPARLALRARRDDPGPSELPLRRRRQPVHVAGGDLLPARPPGGARQAADQHLPRQARRDGARPARGAGRDRRRRSASRRAASSSGSSCRPAPTRRSWRSGPPRRASSGAPGNGFMPNGGGQEFARLAYSYESVEKCYAWRAGVREVDPPVDELMQAPAPTVDGKTPPNPSPAKGKGLCLRTRAIGLPRGDSACAEEARAVGGAASGRGSAAGQDLLDFRDDLGDVERLGDHPRHPSPERGVQFAGVRGDHENWDVAGRLVVLELAHDRPAVFARQRQVERDEHRLLLAGGLDDVAAVLQGEYLVALGFEHEPEQLADLVAILDDEDGLLVWAGAGFAHHG